MRDSAASRFLAAMALVAVGVYCLSCKPAWSPDGDKLAYLCAGDVDGEEMHGVAVYDLASGANTCVFQSSAADRKRGFAPVEVFWPRGGNEVFWLTAGEEEGDSDNAPFRVSAHNLDTGETRTVRRMKAPGLTTGASFLPTVLTDGRWLWYAAEGSPEGDCCFRVDLENGTVDHLSEAGIVMPCGRKLFYFGALEDDSLVAGRIKTFFGLKQTRLFTVPDEKGVSIEPILAMPRDTVRFGVLQERDGIQTAVVFNKRGKEIASVSWSDPIDCEDEVNGAAWSHDGETLWLTGDISNPDGTGGPGIAEIDIATGMVCPIRIDQGDREDELGPMHLSLSPDGRTLAASGIGENTWGLILVDLTKDERPTKVVGPPPMRPVKAEGQ
ncbi:MAG: hypothetical protein GY851_07705 [bacterium]|nr:hypothetical protein [bacterium]